MWTLIHIRLQVGLVYQLLSGGWLRVDVDIDTYTPAGRFGVSTLPDALDSWPVC